MQTYRLRYELHFSDGRSGIGFDTVTIEAQTLEDAIRQAKAHPLPEGPMRLSEAVLMNQAGDIIWSLRREDGIPGAYKEG
ncbi:hypothetical protein J2X36_005216 [Methylobacterium sp. BE186]|uniref:hypothetical protein n=1 Tax=Methylobacterium sp. BE186 TaxID=2817715 RepID=UPI0028563673|nr:hypothetical protein [Methylobacterium sp. BE186]MDR7040433.1 hypothetical protein [Methylobacterium sp. BE186]